MPATCEPMDLKDIMHDELILSWALRLFAAQAIGQSMLSVIPSPMQEKSKVAAHQILCLMPFAYAAWAGMEMLLNPDVAIQRASPDYSARYFECVPEAHALVRMMLGIQIYDLLVTILVPELRKTEHVLHHLITGTFALLALLSGSLIHYSWFFFGIAEISSVPLCFVDLFRQCPKLCEVKGLHILNEQSRILFGVAFLVSRCITWPIVVFQLLRDILAAYAAGDPRLIVPVAAFHLITAVLMTLLQQYWGQKIVKAIMKMLRGDKSGRDKEA